MARNKNIKYVDIPKLVDVLKEKINEGYKIVQDLPISDAGCARAVINMLEFDTTIQQLKGEGRFRVVGIPTKMNANEIDVTEDDVNASDENEVVEG